jgi:competence protein ComEC
VVLATVLGLAARLIGRHRIAYLIPPLAILWLYILLVGAPPSAVRAGLMGTAYLLALATGRASVPVNALGLTALVVLALDPATAWDRSFQLSAAAMAGVLFIGLPLARSAYAHGVTGSIPTRATLQFVLAPAAISLGAVAGSLPLVTFNFGQVPVWSIPATLIAMPLVPPLLISGLLTGAAGLVFSPLASAPRATIETTVDVRWVWAAYAALAAIAAVIYRHRWLLNATDILSAVWRGPTGLPRTIAMVASVALIAALPWSLVAFDHGDGRLHVHYLDVGQGDATLVVGPRGETVLIDGGVNPRQTLNAIDNVLSSGDSRIDLALLTHADADHANGILELARRGRIGTLVVTPALEGDDPELWRALHATGTPIEVASRGATVNVGALAFDVLHPPSPPLRGTSADANNNSLTSLLRWGTATALFTGDLHITGELLITGDINADLLQVGHHGSATSSAAAFLDAASPLAAVISVGGSNRFGHPNEAVVARLRAEVAPGALFVTASDGPITFVSDGQRWYTDAIAAWPTQ